MKMVLKTRMIKPICLLICLVAAGPGSAQKKKLTITLSIPELWRINNKSKIMCLSIPAKILSIDGDKARVSLGGAEYNAALNLVEDVKVGDYILLHWTWYNMFC